MSVSVNQLVDARGRRKRLDSVKLDEQVAESRSRESEREQALPRLSSSGSLRGTLRTPPREPQTHVALRLLLLLLALLLLALLLLLSLLPLD